MPRKLPTPKLGDPFHFLTFQRAERDPTNRAMYWVCQCVCGQMVRSRAKAVRRGYRKSCGCKRAGAHNFQWKGVGELHHAFYTFIRHHAGLRDIEFQVSISFLWELFLSQNRKCAISGLPISFSSQTFRRKGIEQTASLDRIDSTQGYKPGNVWWVHKDINRMKSVFPLEHFVAMCRLVVEQDVTRYRITSAATRTVAR